MTDKDTQNIEKALAFWFAEVGEARWFVKDESLDAKITERFAGVYEDIVAGETSAWRETPKGRLAEIIVLDQFARNMFRGDKKSFAADELALARAKEAIAAGTDVAVSHEERLFFYMPYMHSESRAVHEEALQLFEAYGNENNLKYEKMHKDIIDRFGRYPHRNEILGRESTPEEIEFLKDNPGF